VPQRRQHARHAADVAARRRAERCRARIAANNAKEPERVYVCLCRGLTEKDVRRVAEAGATTPATLIAALGLDDPCCCGRCRRNIDQITALARGEPSTLRPLPLLRLARRPLPQPA
jgi:bacterioferritin-associated ferredoxin